MGLYSIQISQVVTGAVANTMAGLVGIKLANTAGHRIRLREVTVGGGGGAISDVNTTLQIRRTDNAVDGTKTAVAVSGIGSDRPGAVASIVNAIFKNYTVEPTVYQNETKALGSVNDRGTLLKEWPQGEGPELDKNTTLVIQGAPNIATAANLTIGLKWEEGF